VISKEGYVKQHFPDVDPGVRPCGNQIIVQLRTIRNATASGILLAADTQDFNKHNTQVSRLVKVGQIAFKDRSSGETWKEGAWAEVGDVVIAPKYGGFRFEVPIPGQDETAIFAVFNDYDVKMVVEANFETFDRLL